VFAGGSAAVDVASRTDRGVSARANALALHSPLSGRALLGALNGAAPEIFFSAALEVDDAFRPRAARSRTYHYFESDPVGPLEAYGRAAALAVGDIDVRSFGRGVPALRPVVRTVRRFDAVAEGAGLRLEIEGPSFVWGMVRKLVAATRSVARGELGAKEFSEALAGHRRLTVGLAEPEPLVLWDVDYGRPWAVTTDPFRTRKAAYFAGERRAAVARVALLDSLRGTDSDEASILPAPPPPAGDG
jgi:tRNA pseudouridine(38-40) synthase